MDYNVVVTKSAEEDLDRFIQYLLFEKGNEQAAKNVLDDFERTIRTLEQVAGSLKYCENPRLKKAGYKSISFMSHKYFMLYHIAGNRAIVDNIFHELQDYEKVLC